MKVKLEIDSGDDTPPFDTVLIRIGNGGLIKDVKVNNINGDITAPINDTSTITTPQPSSIFTEVKKKIEAIDEGFLRAW